MAERAHRPTQKSYRQREFERMMNKPPDLVPPPKKEVFTYLEFKLIRFGITDTMDIHQTTEVGVESCTSDQIIALYKKIPTPKYKSAEELIDWAKQRSIQSPSIEILKQCIEAKEASQLPSAKDKIECKQFLIRYMSEVDEVCLVKFPAYMHHRPSPYAKDYIVDNKATHKVETADLSFSPHTSPDSSFDDSH